MAVTRPSANAIEIAEMLLTLLQDGNWAASKQSLEAPPSFFPAMLSLLRSPIFFFAPLY